MGSAFRAVDCGPWTDNFKDPFLRRLLLVNLVGALAVAAHCGLARWDARRLEESCARHRARLDEMLAREPETLHGDRPFAAWT